MVGAAISRRPSHPSRRRNNRRRVRLRRLTAVGGRMARPFTQHRRLGRRRQRPNLNGARTRPNRRDQGNHERSSGRRTLPATRAVNPPNFRRTLKHLFRDLRNTRHSQRRYDLNGRRVLRQLTGARRRRNGQRPTRCQSLRGNIRNKRRVVLSNFQRSRHRPRHRAGHTPRNGTSRCPLRTNNNVCPRITKNGRVQRNIMSVNEQQRSLL